MKFISKVVINRPVSVVWEFFDNPDNLKLWLTGFVSFEHLSGTKGEPGARSKHTYAMNGKTMEMIEEISVREPYKTFNGTITGPMITSVLRNEFKDLGNGTTELVSDTDVEFKGMLMKIVSMFIKGSFQKRQDDDLQKFKTLVESR